MLSNYKSNLEILQKTKKEGIILGNWYNTPIAPQDIDIQKTGYTKGLSNLNVYFARSAKTHPGP